MVFKKKKPEKYPNKTIRLLRTPVMASLYQWRSEGCSVVSGFGEEGGGGVGLRVVQILIRPPPSATTGSSREVILTSIA